jgi:hypothetical protein
MQTLEIAYENFAKNVPGSNLPKAFRPSIMNQVRESVRRMNRNPTRTVHVRIMNKPGAVVAANGQKYLITAKGRRLPI